MRTLPGFLVICSLCQLLVAQTSEVPTIRTQANLVVVNVTVTNAAGQPVHGLKRTDFAVREQGQLQTIDSFEEHQAAPRPANLASLPKLPPGEFTNYVPAPETGTLDVLLVDSLNTPMDAQQDLRRQLNDYLRNAPGGHRIAIFGLNSKLYFLQGFTSNPAVLRAAVNRNPVQASTVLANPLDNRPEQHLSDALQFNGGDPDGQYIGTSSGGTPHLREFEARVEAFETETRIRLTLEALDAMGHYLAGLPGRKNLIWFSGAFPVIVGPDPTAVNRLSDVAALREELRKTLDTLRRAQVAVYPVDARGLFNAPQYSAAVEGNTNGEEYATQLTTFAGITGSEHSAMEETAHDTGGRAFFNTNALDKAVNKIVNTGDDYYTLTYSPTKPPSKDVFHNIQVELPGNAQPLQLGYVRGYFGRGRDDTKQGEVDSLAAPGKLPSAAVRVAMTHGAPNSSDILMKAQVLPAVNAAKPPDAIPGASTKAEPAAPHGEKWRRYIVDVAVPPSQLLGPVAKGSAPAAFELAVMCYDANGNLVSDASGSLRIHVPEANLLKLQQEGLRMRQVISVPDKGEYWLRIGVHDLLTDHIGSLEVPIAAVKHLPTA